MADMIDQQRKQHRLNPNKETHSPVFWVAEDVMGSGRTVKVQACKESVHERPAVGHLFIIGIAVRD